MDPLDVSGVGALAFDSMIFMAASGAIATIVDLFTGSLPAFWHRLLLD
jgi:hypothetical protein